MSSSESSITETSTSDEETGAEDKDNDDTESDCDDPPPAERDNHCDDDVSNDTSKGEGPINTEPSVGSGFVGGAPSKGNTVLDSGATEHCAHAVPGELKAATISSIQGLSGAGTKVKGMGNIGKVKNVMSVPNIARNLLSVGRVLDQHGGKVVFTRDMAYFVKKKKSFTLAKRVECGLYLVTDKDFRLEGDSGGIGLLSIATDIARERITALHRAFGHAGVASLRAILKNRNFAGVSVKHLELLEPCDACMLGKAHRAGKKRKQTTRRRNLDTDYAQTALDHSESDL